MINLEALKIEYTNPNENSALYSMMAELRNEYYKDTLDAHICLGFAEDIKDEDGHTINAFCSRLQDDPNWTHIIVLNRKVFNRFTDVTKEAELDHELCHIAFEVDESGKKKWIDRPHGEEFDAILKQHGNYNLDQLAEVVRNIERRQAAVSPAMSFAGK